MDKVKKWFFEEEDEGEEYTTNTTVEPTVEDTTVKTNILEKRNSKASDAISQLNVNKDSNLVLFEPRSFSEASEVGKYLKLKKAAVVNLHRLKKEQAKRVIDFISGVIYAIDGEIQQIGPKIFLCTPKNIGVSGTIDLNDDEVSED